MSESLPQTNPTGPLPYRRGLHAFAVLLVLLTFALIGLGGSVTSHEAGMSVPDWPRSFGYSMLNLPWHLWGQVGVAFEHSHRLVGSLVGAISLVLMLWLWFTQGRRPWLRGMGIIVMVLVIIQGLLGGLRVTESSLVLAIAHGVLGQIFLCTAVLIAAATSRWWIQAGVAAGKNDAPAVPAILRLLAVAMLGALLVQLTLGAGMRHTGSGLAIPDFPTSLGRIIPPVDQQAINVAVQQMASQSAGAQDPSHAALLIPTSSQVGLAFAHRLGATIVAILGLWWIAQITRRASGHTLLTRPALVLLVLLVVQVALGAAVIWTGKQPEVTTAHQATGAATLAVAFLLALRINRAASFLPTRPAPMADAPAEHALEGSLA